MLLSSGCVATQDHKDTETDTQTDRQGNSATQTQIQRHTQKHTHTQRETDIPPEGRSLHPKSSIWCVTRVLLSSGCVAPKDHTQKDTDTERERHTHTQRDTNIHTA